MTTNLVLIVFIGSLFALLFAHFCRAYGREVIFVLTATAFASGAVLIYLTITTVWPVKFAVVGF